VYANLAEYQARLGNASALAEIDRIPETVRGLPQRASRSFMS
jgi:hypothetical protein